MTVTVVLSAKNDPLRKTACQFERASGAEAPFFIAMHGTAEAVPSRHTCDNSLLCGWAEISYDGEPKPGPSISLEKARDLGSDRGYRVVGSPFKSQWEEK
jgi:hypothetical protein